jgi:2-polyprenyl-6-methoxyphenol hydroxylase-like FAD-dependent oxidoreductase
MELLRSWGLESNILAGGMDVELVGWIGPSLAEAAAGNIYEVGYPTRAQAAVISPTAPAAVPQDQLEAVLLDRLRQQASAQIVAGIAVTDLKQYADEVRATMADGRMVRARYVIGADGIRSVVRERLGIAAPVTDNLAAAVAAEFRAPLWEVLGPNRYGLYSTTDVPGLFLPAGVNDRWRFGLTVESVEGALAAYPPERMAKEIRAASGLPDLRPEVGRIGAFTFGIHMAERFRQGNVFLVGDAAHRVTPRGGTGMNLACHDGFDVGWRLAFVILGWADTSLLDGYEAERRPVVEHSMARSADPNGSVRSPIEGLDADLSGRLRHVWLTPGRSSVDVIGPGLTKFVTAHPAAVEATDEVHRCRPPVTTIVLEPIQAHALGMPHGGSIIVRPDGRPWAAER